MAKLFAIKGAKVKILLDDGILYHWDTIQINWLPKQKIYRFPLNPYRITYKSFLSRKYLYTSIINNTRLFFKQGIRAFKDKNIEIIYYSEIIDRKNLNYENWQELKKHAESSTIRFFKHFDLDYNNKEIEYYYKISLLNAIISRNIGEYILNKIKPDVFFNHFNL